MKFAKTDKQPGLLAEFKKERDRKFSSILNTEEVSKLEIKLDQNTSSESISSNSDDYISYISNSQK